MLPDNELSSIPVPTRFFGARSGATSKTVDYEDGGIALNDPSEGLLYQRWIARVHDATTVRSRVTLASPNTPEFDWIVEPNIEEISFTFDANMRPTVAYVAAGQAKLKWYDSAAAEYVTDNLAPDVITPRVSMDDKRPLASGQFANSDVILAYVRGGSMYARVQRDRYLIEYFLAADVKPLIKIGMGRGLRFQFMTEA